MQILQNAFDVDRTTQHDTYRLRTRSYNFIFHSTIIIGWTIIKTVKRSNDKILLHFAALLAANMLTPPQFEIFWKTGYKVNFSAITFG